MTKKQTRNPVLRWVDRIFLKPRYAHPHTNRVLNKVDQLLGSDMPSPPILTPQQSLSPQEANALLFIIHALNEAGRVDEIERILAACKRLGYTSDVNEFCEGASAISGPMSNCVSGRIVDEELFYDKNLPQFQRFIDHLEESGCDAMNQIKSEEQQLFDEIKPNHPEHFKYWANLMRNDFYLFLQKDVCRTITTPPARTKDYEKVPSMSLTEWAHTHELQGTVNSLIRRGILPNWKHIKTGVPIKPDGLRTWDGSSGAIFEQFVCYALGYDTHQGIEYQGKDGKSAFAFLHLNREEVFKTIINSKTFEPYRGEKEIDLTRGAEPLQGHKPPDQSKVELDKGPPYFIVGESEEVFEIAKHLVEKTQVFEKEVSNQFCPISKTTDLPEIESHIELRKRGIHCAMESNTLVLAPDWHEHEHSVVMVMTGIRLGHNFIQAQRNDKNPDQWEFQELKTRNDFAHLIQKIREINFLSKVRRKPQKFIRPEAYHSNGKTNGKNGISHHGAVNEVTKTNR